MPQLLLALGTIFAFVAIQTPPAWRTSIPNWDITPASCPDLALGKEIDRNTIHFTRTATRCA